MIALDSSALLAFMLKEPGGERVAKALRQSCMSTVNLAEVLSFFARTVASAAPVLPSITATHVEIVQFDAAQALIAADLLPRTKSLGLWLGDRACLALAISRGIPVMTGDRAWAHLARDIAVELIR